MANASLLSNSALLERAAKPTPPLGEVDAALWSAGRVFCGVDEAGAGPLAGPVVAAACVLPAGLELPPALRDSKQMTERQREEVYAYLTTHPDVRGAVFFGSVERIDSEGIRPVNLEVMRRAATEVLPDGGVVLVDHHHLDMEDGFTVFPLTKGDRRSLAIAAASVLAKVSRDRHMSELDDLYPGYGFASHKGYGTALHRAAIKRLGPSPAHRRSFRLG